METTESGLHTGRGRVYRRSVQFRVLGPLEVDAGSGPIPLGGPKQRAVLAHLLVRPNQLVPSESLIDEIWGDEPPETARNTLQTYVSHLRKALGDGRIVGRPPGYVLTVDPSELDAARFDDLLREARKAQPVDPAVAVSLLDDALSLWRGPALADVAGESSLVSESARLDELRLVAQEDRIEGLLASGQPARAIGELEALIGRHPLRERMWGQLMIALYRDGRQAEGLDAFQRVRELLADELGIDPSPELVRLRDRILQQDPQLDLKGEPLRGYRLMEKIGEGPTGLVFRGVQPRVGRDVAVKIVDARLTADPAFVRRFEPEAQAVAALEHPHIAPVYDYWRDPAGSYIVSRYLRGGSLRAIEERGQPLEPARRVRIIQQIASALAFAHRQGVAHGSVRPSNVVLDAETNAYLCDFRIGIGPDPSPAEDVIELAALAREMLADQASASLSELLERMGVGDDAPGAAALAEALGIALEPGGAAPGAIEARNPYKGLRAFAEPDARDFFGRGALVERLVARLNEAGKGSRFLAIVGPSGSGKSSVARAGLVPAIRRGALPGSESCVVVEMFPGARPMEELEEALLRIAPRPIPRLHDRLATGSRGLIEAAGSALPIDTEMVLVVDQFEEIFTLAHDEPERELFLESLRVATVDPSSRLRVIVTLRADFYDRPLAYPRFGELLGARAEVVPPLTPDELEQAIRGPAERVGVHPEPGLIAEMIADVTHQPGALPLLQYALTELFERRDADRLTLDAYQAIGGVTGALSSRAERLHEGSPPEGRRAIRQVLLRLVSLGEGRQDTRRRVARSELDALELDPAAIDGVLDAFGRHRLVTFDREPATREPTIEIAHEALLGSWTRLRGWIDDAREDLRLERQVARASGEWRASRRDSSFLLRGARLDEVATWVEGTDLAIGAAEREFLRTSADQRESERAEDEQRRKRESEIERRSHSRLRALVAVLTVAALVASALTLVAVSQRGQAQRAVRIATARELAAAAVSSVDVDTERSLLLALEAVQTTYRIDGTVLPEAEEALHRALQAHRLVLTVPGSSGEFSDDGSRLLVAGLEPGRADVYDATTLERISTVIGAGSRVGPSGRLDVAFSADGGLFATAGDSGDIRLYETASGEEVLRLSHPEGALFDPTFSPNGRYLATGGPNRGCCPRTYLFDLRTGELLSIHHAIGLVAFSPEGKRHLIADSWYDSLLDAWVAGYVADAVERGRTRFGHAPDVPTYDLPGQEADVPFYEGPVGAERIRGLALLGHEGDVNGAAWSPDGARLATSSPGQLIVWDASTPKPYELKASLVLPEFTVSPPTGQFTTVGFGPGSRIATGMSDGTTIVWSLSADGAQPILSLAGHDAEVRGVDFSVDGTRLTTSGNDGKVRVWDITRGGGHEWMTLAGSGGVSYSPDGSRLAIGSEDGDVHVYETASGEEALVLRGHEGRVNAVAFDPGGSRLASAGFSDGTARTWDAMSGAELATIDLAPSRAPPCELYPSNWKQVFDVDFSPNGSMLATGGWSVASSSTLIWDPATGELQRTLPHYANAQREWGRSVDFSPDGILVAGEGWDFVFVWAVDGRILARIQEPQVNALAFSPDGRRLVTGSLEGGVKVWEARTGRQLDSLTGTLGQVLDLAVSPDGDRLATSSSDGAVRLWDLRNGQQILTLARGVAGEVGAESKFCFRGLPPAKVGVGGKLAFSPDGTRLAYTAADGTVRVLALAIDDLIDLARSRLTRSWTRDECETYLHLDRCSLTLD